MINLIVYLDKKINVDLATIKYVLCWAKNVNRQLNVYWPYERITHELSSSSLIYPFDTDSPNDERNGTNIILQELKNLGAYEDLMISKISFILKQDDADRIKESEEWESDAIKEYVEDAGIDISLYSINDVCYPEYDINGIIAKQLYLDITTSKSCMTMIMDNVLPDGANIRYVKSLIFYALKQIVENRAKIIVASEVIDQNNLTPFINRQKKLYGNFYYSNFNVIEKYEKSRKITKLQCDGSSGMVKYFRNMRISDVDYLNESEKLFGMFKRSKGNYLDISENVYFVNRGFLTQKFYNANSKPNSKNIKDFYNVVQQAALEDYSIFFDINCYILPHESNVKYCSLFGRIVK